MRVVFFIIKNVLSVYTSKHHMIDTCSAGFSWTSCHILSQIFYKSKKYIANHQIIQKQNRTKGQTPCAMTSHNTKENPARNIPSEAFGYTIAQGVCPRVSRNIPSEAFGYTIAQGVCPRVSQARPSVILSHKGSVPVCQALSLAKSE